MKHMFCESYPISLFVTGSNIIDACQRYCGIVGLCVTVTETIYTFRGGEEDGYIVGLINYPRFPKDPYELEEIALSLGKYLIEECNPKGSFTMQTPYRTHFYSNRPGD